MEIKLLSERKSSAFILGLFIFLGLFSIGYILGKSALEFKQHERSVTVKGLSEREYPADIVIWPISFTETSNDLSDLYASVQGGTDKIINFLKKNGIKPFEISTSTPSITDKSAHQYSKTERPEYRYTATKTVSVYSTDIEKTQQAMRMLSDLGKEGIVLTSGGYDSRTEYLFKQLNDVKPEMIEESTRNARVVAEKFAVDSNSTLGKIKKASQGQFSISNRDKNTPYIKKVRVVSTVEYYLSD